jgi:hypothetical protein
VGSALAVNQAGALEALKMLGSVSNAHRAGLGQLLDATRRLYQQIQQLQSMRVGGRLRDLCDDSIQGGFCFMVVRHSHILNYSIDLLNS